MGRKKSSIEKKVVTLLLDRKIYEEFQKYCEKNGFVVSGRVSWFMSEELKKWGCKNDK